jgi:hypothetical protein
LKLILATIAVLLPYKTMIIQGVKATNNRNKYDRHEKV